MSSVRAASNVRMHRKIEEQDRMLQLELSAERTQGQVALADGDQSRKEYNALYSLASRYARENIALHKLLKEMQTKVKSQAVSTAAYIASGGGGANIAAMASRGNLGSGGESSSEMARLELTLAQREATINSQRAEIERLLVEYGQVVAAPTPHATQPPPR